MTTYGVMQNRIAREVQRDGITAEIEDAIVAAWTNYRHEAFGFLDSTASAVLTASAALVPEPTGLRDVHFLELSGSASGRTSFILRPDSFENVKRTQNAYLPTSTGIPERWSRFAGNIYFDIPANDRYSVKVYGQIDPTEISVSASVNATNAWMTHGERLVRFKALAYLYAGRLKNPSRAALYERYAEDERVKQRSELPLSNQIEPQEF